MNWFTEKKNVVVTEEDDHCSHLEVGSMATFRQSENDSFGPVARYCMCAECYQEYLKEMTPYELDKDHLFTVMKITVTKMADRCQGYDENEFATFMQNLRVANSFGFQRVPTKHRGHGVDYELYVGDEDGNVTNKFLAAWVVGENEIMARYNDLVCQLTNYLEHQMPGGGWIGVPVQPSRSLEWLPMEGNMISNTVIRNIENPALPTGFRWKGIPSNVVVHPIDDYETEVCHDCKKPFFKKDGIEWKWYDFYAAQGDEPLSICNQCRKGETHRHRVERDRVDYEEEMGRYDDD